MYKKIGEIQRRKDPDFVTKERVYTIGEMHYLAEKLVEKVLKDFNVTYQKKMLIKTKLIKDILNLKMFQISVKLFYCI